MERIFKINDNVIQLMSKDDKVNLKEIENVIINITENFIKSIKECNDESNNE